MPGLRAVRFQLDGVLTATAALHASARERLFALWSPGRDVSAYAARARVAVVAHLDASLPWPATKECVS
jgi:beta-phosphoglucomutase-like phosphatase (HAD superfamily)